MDLTPTVRAKQYPAQPIKDRKLVTAYHLWTVWLQLKHKRKFTV